MGCHHSFSIFSFVFLYIIEHCFFPFFLNMITSFEHNFFIQFFFYLTRDE